MLTRILHNSQELCTFVEGLNLRLNAPQRRHVLNVADGLLVSDAPNRPLDSRGHTRPAEQTADCDSGSAISVSSPTNLSTSSAPSFS